MMKFSDFDIHSNLEKGLTEAGYIECTPVQEASLKAALTDRRDVYAQSQTGTGKTAAFLVPVLHMLSENNNQDEFGLVLTPTRELALQVEKEAKYLGKYLNLKIVHVLGGVDFDKQEKGLKASPRLIVATPGRLLDFMDRGVINLKKTKYLVIDEADRLFDMGFQDSVLTLLRAMPGRTEKMSFLFSATLNTKVGNLVWEYMNDPVDIVIEPEHMTVEAIEQELYHVARTEKMSLLLALIHQFKPRNVIIFSNTKVGAEQIAKTFARVNLKCGVLEGDVPQEQRIRVINDLMNGKLKYLAATDVAARGLHIPHLDWVINFDLPNEAENYVHRIGRTARAGCTGRAISFACERYVYNLTAIEHLIRRKIPVVWPSEELQEKMAEAEQALKTRSGRFKRTDRKPRGEAPQDVKRDTRPKNRKQRGAKAASSFVKGEHASRKGRSDRFAEKDKKRKEPVQRKPKNRGSSQEERLQYYKEKYGDNFVSASSSKSSSQKSAPRSSKKPAKKKSGFWNQIVSLFKRKK